MLAKVYVTLKNGVLDPQGKAIHHAATTIGYQGIADVRQAIREAGQARIHTYALAVDVQAKLYLPEMFGAGNYQILPHPSYLVHSLAQLYTRLWY